MRPEGRHQTCAFRESLPGSGLCGGLPSFGSQRNGAGLAQRTGPTWEHQAPASPRPPYLGQHLAGPPTARALVHQPTETPENPGRGWPCVPTPAKLTCRGQALPALATTPRPGGAGQGPAQDTPSGLCYLPWGGAPSGSAPPRPRLRLRHRRVASHAGSSRRKEATPSMPIKREVPPSADKYPEDSLLAGEATLIRGRAARVFTTERQSWIVRPRPAPRMGPPYAPPPAAQPPRALSGLGEPGSTPISWLTLGKRLRLEVSVATNNMRGLRLCALALTSLT